MPLSSVSPIRSFSQAALPVRGQRLSPVSGVSFQATFGVDQSVFSKNAGQFNRGELKVIQRQLKDLEPFLPLKKYDQKLSNKNHETETDYQPVSLYDRFLELPKTMQDQVVEALADPLLPLKLNDPTLEGKRELCDVLWELAYERRLSFHNLPLELRRDYSKAIKKKSKQCRPSDNQLEEEIEELLEDGNARKAVKEKVQKIITSTKTRKEMSSGQSGRKLKMNQDRFNQVLKLMGWEGQLGWKQALQIALNKAQGRYAYDLKQNGQEAMEANKKMPYHRRKYAICWAEKVIAAHQMGDASRVLNPLVWVLFARLKTEHFLKEKIFGLVAIGTETRA